MKSAHSLWFIGMMLCCHVGKTQSVVSHQVFASSGNSFSFGNLVSSTLGEAFIFDGQSQEHMACQGFQGGAGLIHTAVHQLEDSKLQVEYFPNPATTHIIIHSKSKDACAFELRDIMGRLLISVDARYGATQIEMNVSSLPQGPYALFHNDLHGNVRFLGWIMILHT